MLSNFLHSFVESGRAGVPFRPAALPVLGLSKGDKQCIRDRSYIMARHIFADKSEDYIHSQVFHCILLFMFPNLLFLFVVILSFSTFKLR